MTPTLDQLRSAWKAYEVYALANVDHSERLLRQPGHFLVVQGDTMQFAPIRFLIAWCNGTPFDRKGRSISMATYKDALLSMGFTLVDESSDAFDLIWSEWSTQCLATGKPLANYINPTPKTGRQFWMMPHETAQSQD